MLKIVDALFIYCAIRVCFVNPFHANEEIMDIFLHCVAFLEICMTQATDIDLSPNL